MLYLQAVRDVLIRSLGIMMILAWACPALLEKRQPFWFVCLRLNDSLDQSIAMQLFLVKSELKHPSDYQFPHPPDDYDIQCMLSSKRVLNTIPTAVS